jgi:hypothetical protein
MLKVALAAVAKTVIATNVSMRVEPVAHLVGDIPVKTLTAISKFVKRRFN